MLADSYIVYDNDTFYALATNIVAHYWIPDIVDVDDTEISLEDYIEICDDIICEYDPIEHDYTLDVLKKLYNDEIPREYEPIIRYGFIEELLEIVDKEEYDFYEVDGFDGYRDTIGFLVDCFNEQPNKDKLEAIAEWLYQNDIDLSTEKGQFALKMKFG